MATPLHSVSGKIHVRLTGGRFNTIRVGFVLFTQLIYFGLPWLDWGGQQATRFDFGSMRLYLFGLTLLPQEFIYLAGVLIVCALGLFLWTMLAGRLWCGFSCPQTVYTEIMLWIERWIEGPPNQRRKRDAGPWGADKLLRKGGSQLIMALFSLWSGLTLVGYFTPMRELAANIVAGHIGTWEALFALGYAGFTWLLAGVLREQVCKHMCPYARFQGVMYDRDTLMVAYDTQRGEPRGTRRKQHAIIPVAPRHDSTDKPQGACIDCGLCVQVCPTGIDIRQGLQYECIGCAACIDVCDDVMDKTGQARGLIRFSTQNAMERQQAVPPLRQRPRALFYSGILVTVVVLCATGLAVRMPFKVDILRDRAVMTRESNDGYIENVYNVRIMNTERDARHYRLQVHSKGIVRVTAPELVVPGDGVRSFNVTLLADPAVLEKGSHGVTMLISSSARPGQILSEEARVLMP